MAKGMHLGDVPASTDRQQSLIRAFHSDIEALGYSGFDAFCYEPNSLQGPVRPGNWAVASYDLGIIRNFVAEGMAAICPALREAGKNLRPYDYMALLRDNLHNPSAVWQLRFLKLFRVHHAWMVPMSSVHFVKGMTVYMQGRGAAAEQRFHATRDEIHLRSLHFFEALEAIGPTVPDDYTRALGKIGPLTPREDECLQWAAAGKTNAETAVILGISENTVRYHFKSILTKLGARSRAQAVAMRRGTSA